MLERTAGCLESGSLRSLLPGSKKALKSRRELHSGFWNHGAFGIELSPLWAGLVRSQYSADQSYEREQKTSTDQGGMLLDFLYPAGTMRFLRQYSSWGFDRQDGRRSIAGAAKLGHRLYTSSAKETASSHTDLEEVEDKQEDLDNEAGWLYLKEVLGIQWRSDYDEAWQKYSQLDISQQQRLGPALIQYFIHRNRVVDAERIVEVFDKLSERRKLKATYLAAIQAYLKLRNVSDAVTLNKEYVGKFGLPGAADRLLAYMIDNSLWSHAAETWQQFRSFQNQPFGGPSDILELVYNLPSIKGQTLELADYVSREIGLSTNTSEESLSRLLVLASRMVKTLLFKLSSSDQIVFNKLLEILERWGVDTPDVYEHCLEQLLLDPQNPKPAVKLYRKARRIKDIQFSRRALHGLLQIFCAHHSVLGMQQVLDDFFRCHGRPSKRTYQMCMKEFASQGEADTVHALFDQYTQRFQVEGKLEISADEFAPLLHVHAKRGELAAVIKIFNEIKDLYNLKPTILSWNIVLNAHAKVHDVDGAFAWFEQLLETTALQPDDYTFGTMMGICATRRDRERAVELYKLAGSMGIQKTTAMIDSLVFTYLRDEYFKEAERLCEDCLEMKLKGSRTRMWNYLLVTYALRRDLSNVNRILRRMAQVKIEYDQFTYSALMQALAMVKQPDRAKSIMSEVMKEAGMTPTNIHYAVLMGGYIANTEYHKVFHVQNQMRRRGIGPSAGSRLLAIKAAAAEDQKILETGTEEQKSQRALQIFQETLRTMDSSELSQPISKGTGVMPQDVAYSTMIHSFVMFVLSQRGELDKVKEVYKEYIKTLPESRRDSPPIKVLSALMISKLQAHDFAAAQECWDLALSQARKIGRSIPQKEANVSNPSQILQILPDHKLDLTELITTQMTSLSIQRKTDDIPPLINALLEEGFLLDNNNWNHYIQILARRYRYKLAFQLCEKWLMPNWTGWARIRWQAPERNRLPIEIRNLKKMPKHYRPKAHTLLYLGRGYLEMQSMAAESPASQIMLAELEGSCPKTINAIRTMQRTDDALERDVLQNYVV